MYVSLTQRLNLPKDFVPGPSARLP